MKKIKTVLGRKQSISNNDWIKAVNNIENLISRQEVEQIEKITITEIIKNTKGKKSAYAWSGGKDSIVLSHLCRKAGINNCMIGLCNLEYPAFLSWININKPENLEIINTGQDMQWLIKNPKALFPPMTYHWSVNLQIKSQNIYYKNHKLDMLILGRRKADGNFIGNGTNLYTDSKGRTKYNPLSEWKHEHILGYIYYKKLSVPPFYNWKDGYRIGTHPWFARPYINNVNQGWKEIYDIDKNIVYNASRHIKSAELFLRRI